MIVQNPLLGSDGFESLDVPSADLRYWPGWLTAAQAAAAYAELTASVPWHQAEIWVGGQKRLIPRLQCWMGDVGTQYRYSGTSFAPMPWVPAVAKLKVQLEEDCNARFNSVLLNWYRTGQDSVSWHADDEPELGKTPIIASLSLGATRVFKLRPQQRPKGVKTLSLALHHGDLLLMAGATQQHWQHALPKAPSTVAGRLNLTFRWVITDRQH